MTINLSPQEASIFNAAWTLIEKMDDRIKVALYLQLGKSNKVIEDSKKMTHKEALKLVKSLSLKPSVPIPADEDGKGALAKSKYY